ncbi:MAG: hypothetical protein P0Y66_02490 [Candidatus Kaistia colombiensis]|nr:MAG: hypothetical protein P0Y66_02490 [Kaistia sp.]
MLSAAPSIEPREVADDLNEVHADVGILARMIGHVHWLTLDISVDEAPDEDKLLVIQGILAMSSAWAERLDGKVGDAASNEMQRRAGQRRQAKVVSA